jgi:hypothetical protein
LSSPKPVMTAVAFAYIMILCRGADKKDLLNFLSQDRRAEVDAVLEKVKDLSSDQVRLKLKALRGDQLNQQREDAKSRIGLRIDRVSPKLFAWLTRPF